MVGLLALTIYILACNSSPSFSPDDTKVLYPAFDPVTGVVGMSVYDREAGTSEMLFLIGGYDAKETDAQASPTFLRGQWLPNGKETVVAYNGPGESDDGGPITLVVVPWETRKPVKTLILAADKEAWELFLKLPLCVVGEKLFFCVADNECVRVDLRTGILSKHQFEAAKGKLALYPSADGNGVFYVEQPDDSEAKSTFGRLNPEDFSRTPLMAVTNRLYDEAVAGFDHGTKGDHVFAYDREGKTLVCLKAEDAKAELTVWRDSRVTFWRSVDTHKEKLAFGNAVLAASGKAVLASYATATGTNAVSYGLMELPFSDALPREVTLIHEAPAKTEGCVSYFQTAVSHDGKTAAITSTYLGVEAPTTKPEDCALFLVDLTDPKWKVTKVPIPMPIRRPSTAK
jgi:hypothetical protein